MRRISFCLAFFSSFLGLAQISYNFSATTGSYVYNAGTSIIGTFADESISASTAIGFSFQFGCNNTYTTFQASSNGVLYLGTALGSAPSNSVANLSGSAIRPVIAPLWDDLETSSTGNVNYKLSGTSPNRTLTVEWLNMMWTWGAGAKVISFQTILYETSNQIDFMYKIENAGNISSPAAAIGLAGQTSADFYSLNSSGASPTASKTTETDNIATCPATGQIYRWTQNLCSGTPSGITASSSPSSLCAAGTTTLSLSSTTGCGLTYQWQSASAGTGPWTNIAGGTSATQTVSVPAAGSYYQCVITCSASGLSGNSSTVQVAIGAPANNDCAGAIDIPIGTCVPGDVNCASQSQAGCTGTANDDVWYSFVATSTTHVVSMSASASFDPVVQVFSGSCGALTSIWCNDAVFTTSGSLQCKKVTGLTVGNTYYLRVYDYYAGTPATTTFTICISSGITSSCNLNYSYSSIANSQDAGVSNVVSLSDDHLSNALALPFGFCYDGFLYTQVYVSSNASLVFDAVDPCVPNVNQTRAAASNGAATGYQIAAPAPTTTDYTPQNAILGPWHDIDPGNGGTITYATLGTAPNRRFVVYFNAVKQFYTNSPFGTPCQNASYDYTGQIKLYETTNNIEIHIQQMNSCAAWNNGQAILGLHNGYGTMAVVPAGYNANAASPYNVYSITNAAWRFTNNCTTCNILLPIELTEFSAAKKDERSNLLKWVTASEQEIKCFRLEHSTDGVHFNEVLKTVARNPKGGAYEYQDLLEEDNQTYYYRIATENLDGTIAYSGIRLVERDINARTSVRNVYPNPFTDKISIDLESAEDDQVTVEVFGGFGRRVYSENFTLASGANTIQLDDLEKQNGLYLVRVTDNSGKVLLLRKMIKQ